MDMDGSEKYPATDPVTTEIVRNGVIVDPRTGQVAGQVDWAATAELRGGAE